MTSIVLNKDLVVQLIKAGNERIKAFSWITTGEETLQILLANNK